MKAPILILLMVSLGAVYTPVYAQSGGGAIQLDFEFSPEPAHMQMVYNETYIFAVKVVNLNLDLEKDEVVDPDEPHFRFSGNLVLDTFFTVKREGNYQLGSESEKYNYTLDRHDESDDILLPEIGGFSSRWFSYACTTGYDGKNVTLDEWLTFSIDVSIYIEEYREISGVKKYYLGDLVSEAHLTFYVISDEKKDFVKDTMKSLNREVNNAEYTISNIEDELNEELEVDLTEYENIYNTMKACIDDGDYVSAMKEYSVYDPTWKDDLINLLQQRVGYMKPFEELLANYSTEFSELTADYQALQADYENFTASHLAEVEVLNSELTIVKTNSRLYLFVMMALAAVSVIVIVRMFTRKS